MNKKLYVGNLSLETGDAQLEELFGKAGKVESVRVMRDMVTGRGRRFAFVEMASERDAQNAVSMFNEYSLHGRSLTVNEARRRWSAKAGAIVLAVVVDGERETISRTGLELAPCFKGQTG